MGNTQTPITTFSFQTVRLPNSIDGGALAFNDEGTYQKALRMRDFGINRSNFRDELNEISCSSDISHLGYNAIMNEINALVGSRVMEHTPELIAKQRLNATRWDDFCAGKGYQRLNGRAEIKPNYWIYSFLTPNQKQSLISIRESGYYASKVHMRNDYYSCFGSFNNTLLGVKEFENRQISVPSGWWINRFKLAYV
jgi:perosamine synthetase